jgi:hypothetical protein
MQNGGRRTRRSFVWVVTKGEERTWQQGICRVLGGGALRARSCVVVVWQRKCHKSRGRTRSSAEHRVGAGRRQ